MTNLVARTSGVLFYVEVLEETGEAEPRIVHQYNVLAPDGEQAVRAARKFARRAGTDVSATRYSLTEPTKLPGDFIVA